jgi:cytochrome c oxidase subunit 2
MNGQSTLEPHSHAASSIATLWWVMFVGSVVVLAVVLVLLFAGILLRRSDAGSRLGSGTALVGIGGLAVPAVVLVGLFALTLATIPDTSPASAARADLTVDVTARQWFWDVSYQREGIRDANEIHVPVGRTVNVRVHSGDVIHSLWVPELNRKIDVIPGKTNTVTLRADDAGVYRGQCAEFCGIQHAHMALYVVAEAPAAFARWVARERRPPPSQLPPRLARGRNVFMTSACLYCHTVAGTQANGKVGPDLTHIASRRSLGAGTLPNDPGRLAEWILDPQHVKPGNKMPGITLSGDRIELLLEYLETLK